MLQYYMKLNIRHSNYSRKVNIYRFSRKWAVTKWVRLDTLSRSPWPGTCFFATNISGYIHLYERISCCCLHVHSLSLPDDIYRQTVATHQSITHVHTFVCECSLFCLRLQRAQISCKRWNEKFSWILNCVYTSESYEKTAWFLRVNILNFWTENAFVLQVALPEFSIYKYE